MATMTPGLFDWDVACAVGDGVEVCVAGIAEEGDEDELAGNVTSR